MMQTKADGQVVEKRLDGSNLNPVAALPQSDPDVSFLDRVGRYTWDLPPEADQQDLTEGLDGDGDPQREITDAKGARLDWKRRPQ